MQGQADGKTRSAAGRDDAEPRRPEPGESPRRQDGAPRAPTALDLAQAELTPANAALFAKCEERIGFVPNVLRAYAHDNAKLEAFTLLYNDLMLGPSGLSKLEREMIAVAVSAENRCHYCITAHGAAVRVLSGDPVLGETIAANWRAADLSPRHRAMLAFAATMSAQSHAVGEPDRQAVREAGFADRDIWDIAAVAGFFAMSNRMASALGMRPNPEYHGQGR